MKGEEKGHPYSTVKGDRRKKVTQTAQSKERKSHQERENGHTNSTIKSRKGHPNSTVTGEKGHSNSTIKGEERSSTIKGERKKKKRASQTAQSRARKKVCECSNFGTLDSDFFLLL